MGELVDKRKLLLESIVPVKVYIIFHHFCDLLDFILDCFTFTLLFLPIDFDNDFCLLGREGEKRSCFDFSLHLEVWQDVMCKMSFVIVDNLILSCDYFSKVGLQSALFVGVVDRVLMRGEVILDL